MRGLLVLALFLFAPLAEAQYAPVTVTWSNLPPAPSSCISPVIYVVSESASFAGPFTNVAVVMNGSLSVGNVPVHSNPAFFVVVMRCPGVGYIASSGILRWAT